jgi:hypothetical protein
MERRRRGKEEMDQSRTFRTLVCTPGGYPAPASPEPPIHFFFFFDEKSRRGCHSQADDFVDVHPLGTVLPCGILFLVSISTTHSTNLYGPTIRLEIELGPNEATCSPEHAGSVGAALQEKKWKWTPISQSQASNHPAGMTAHRCLLGTWELDPEQNSARCAGTGLLAVRG